MTTSKLLTLSVLAFGSEMALAHDAALHAHVGHSVVYFSLIGAAAVAVGMGIMLVRQQKRSAAASDHR